MSDSPASNAVALLPCPFCGGEATQTDDDAAGKGIWIGCLSSECGVAPYVTTTCVNGEDAAAEWNRRAPPVETAAPASNEVADIGHVINRLRQWHALKGEITFKHAADELERLSKITQRPEQTADCPTCNDTGEVDCTLGGYSFSDPHAPCPDCRSPRETPDLAETLQTLLSYKAGQISPHSDVVLVADIRRAAAKAAPPVETADEPEYDDEAGHFVTCPAYEGTQRGPCGCNERARLMAELGQPPTTGAKLECPHCEVDRSREPCPWINRSNGCPWQGQAQKTRASRCDHNRQGAIRSGYENGQPTSWCVDCGALTHQADGIPNLKASDQFSEWVAENVAAFGCEAETNGQPLCSRWCGHPHRCVAHVRPSAKTTGSQP